MLPLREYLASRRAEVQAQLKALRAELVELDAAERALSGGGDEQIKSGALRTRGTAGSGKKTLKELALEALQARPEGAETVQIIADIKERHGIDVPRESMSPQMSRLRHEGIVVREGSSWRLVQMTIGAALAGPSKDETPDGQTSGVSADQDSGRRTGDLIGDSQPTPASTEA